MRAILDQANQLTGRALTRLGVALSHPAAFIVAFLYLLFWGVAEPRTLDLHGIVAMAAFNDSFASARDFL